MRKALLLSMVLACGRVQLHDVPADDAGVLDAGTDAGIDAGTDAGTDGGTDAGVVETPPDAGPWRTQRVVLHLHSAISHDACDGHSDNGGALSTLDQSCMDDLEAALCADRIDVAFLTDHPAFVDGKAFEDTLLLRGHGEQRVFDTAGHVIGSEVHCPDGHVVRIAPGWEGPHTMPLGLQSYPAGPIHMGTNDGTPIADIQAGVKAIHDSGGIFFTAHSEEEDVSAATLAQAGSDGMEWYNTHGNFKALLGGDTLGADFDLQHVQALIDTVKGLEPFLLGGSAQADLVYLSLLDSSFPEKGLQKWHDVTGMRAIAGGLGNDVHQNVSVKPLCKGTLAMAACKAVASAYPNLLTALAAGGMLELSDGKRLDSYARILRWLNNRAIVRGPDDAASAIALARAAIGRGRSAGVFGVFGEPGEVWVRAETAQGTLEMGDTGPAAGATLVVHLPERPVPELGVQWTSADASRAVLEAVLWRTTAAGREKVGTFANFGDTVRVAAPGPGAYSLEARLVPLHLEAALGPAGALASKTFRWVLTNAVRLE